MRSPAPAPATATAPAPIRRRPPAAAPASARPPTPSASSSATATAPAASRTTSAPTTTATAALAAAAAARIAYCQPGDFCNLNINQCCQARPRRRLCDGRRVQVGVCYSGVCCNTTCGDATQSCNNTGNVGQCQCTGHACPRASPACCSTRTLTTTPWRRQRDPDQRQRGRRLYRRRPAVPVGFSADNTDCDDADNLVHPGQNLWFSTPRSDGSFDYNCNGVFDHGIPEKW